MVSKNNDGGLQMYKIYLTCSSGIRKFKGYANDENEMIQKVDKILAGSKGVVEVMKFGATVLLAA